MAVFEELNRHSERLQDPEDRKAEKITRANAQKKKKRPGSSSVSVNTYKRTMLFVNIGATLLIIAAVAVGGYFAIQAFIN